MSDNFAAAGLLLAFAIVLPIVVMAVVHWVAPHKPHKEKLTTYECGICQLVRLGLDSRLIIFFMPSSSPLLV